MKTPKTLKSAIANGYIIEKIQYANTPKCCVDLKPRFYKPGMPAYLSFWINTKFVARNYPNAYERNRW